MKYIYYFNTVAGRIGICEENCLITDILFLDDETCLNENRIEGAIVKETEVINDAANQLYDYFRGEREVFDLPLSINGTSFQNMVWRALLEIPYGQTRSYKDIAVQIGKNKACRAIGMANNRNRIPIIIPCHRVIGSKGELAGYAGGLKIKATLLELEGINIVNGRVR